MPFFSPRFWSPHYWGRYWGTGAAAPVGAITLGVALAAALKADPALVAIVGERVFPVVLPGSAPLPAVYFRIVSRNREHTLDGGAGGAEPRVQFGLCSLRYGDLAAMQRALRDILDGFVGLLGTLQITAAIASDEVDQVEDYGDGSGRSFYHRAVDYLIHHREVVPAPADLAGTEDNLEEALVAAVKADTGIAALVNGRVYPGMVPEGTSRPAIWYQVMTRSHEHTLDAAAGGAVAGWRFGVQARDYRDLEALAELLRRRFQGLAGTLGAVEVTSALAQDESDTWIDPQEGSSVVYYERAVDFSFEHRESIPTF